MFKWASARVCVCVNACVQERERDRIKEYERHNKNTDSFFGKASMGMRTIGQNNNNMKSRVSVRKQLN